MRPVCTNFQKSHLFLQQVYFSFRQVQLRRITFKCKNVVWKRSFERVKIASGNVTIEINCAKRFALKFDDDDVIGTHPDFRLMLLPSSITWSQYGLSFWKAKTQKERQSII